MNKEFHSSLAEDPLDLAWRRKAIRMPIDADIAIAVKGLDNRFQAINQAMGALIGESAENIVGRIDSDFFPSDIASWLRKSDQQVINEAAIVSNEFNVEINRNTTRCLWLEFPLLAFDGTVHSIGTVIVDISKSEDIAVMQQSMELLQETNQNLKNELAELDRLAGTDKLTGVWNRRRLEESVASEIDRLKRYGHPLSALIIDIDFFKKINDTFGHVIGDQVLIELAATIRSALRATDSLTRWGGEEFVVLGPCTTLPTMAILAERLRERVARAVFPCVDSITVSIGVAECLPGETWEQLLARADTALYSAKKAGRNLVRADRKAPSRTLAKSDGIASFVQLAWHSAYESGNAIIDDQHRTLFLDANNVISAILSQQPKDVVENLIDVLTQDVVKHFRDEEEILTSAGFPGVEEHADIHRQMIKNGAILVKRFKSGDVSFGELFQFLAHDVIARHLLRADRGFFPYLL